MPAVTIPRALLPLIALVAALAGFAAPADAADRGSLAHVAAAHPGRTFDAFVRLDSATTAARGRALVRRRGGRVTGDLHIIHGLAIRIRARAAARLARERGIAGVTLDAAIAPQSMQTTDLRTA